MFFSSVREGPIYGCVCCHRIKFKKGVLAYNDQLKEKIKEQNSNLIEKAVGIPKGEFMIDKTFFICEDCKTKLLKGKMPSLSHKNKPGMVNIS